MWQSRVLFQQAKYLLSSKARINLYREQIFAGPCEHHELRSTRWKSIDLKTLGRYAALRLGTASNDLHQLDRSSPCERPLVCGLLSSNTSFHCFFPLAVAFTCFHFPLKASHSSFDLPCYPHLSYTSDNQSSNHNMPAPDLAYCSTIPGALTLLLQIMTGSVVAALYLSGCPGIIDFHRDTCIKVFSVFCLASTIVFLMAATLLVESLTAAELLDQSTRKKLRCSLYLARIKLFRFLGLVVALAILPAIYTTDK